MDNKIIEQLREEAKDALIHWAKTDKGYFMMKDALEKYFEATGANRSCGNSKEMPTHIDGALFKSSISR